MKIKWSLTFSLLIFLLLAANVLLSGCKSLSHMDELFLLKRFSREQSQIASEVEASDQKFEDLIAAVETGAIAQYQNASQVTAVFGAPVLTEKVQEDGTVYVRWLYRYATQFFGSPKIYLYFDAAGSLAKWDYMP